MTDIIKSNDAYKKWITQIKEQYRKSQIKAASSVNREMLMFYWELGRNLEIVKAQYDWGSNFYKVISDDIKRELPDVKSFSPRNLLYMHQFYRLYSLETITPQDGAHHATSCGANEYFYDPVGASSIYYRQVQE